MEIIMENKKGLRVLRSNKNVCNLQIPRINHEQFLFTITFVFYFLA